MNLDKAEKATGWMRKNIKKCSRCGKSLNARNGAFYTTISKINEPDVCYAYCRSCQRAAGGHRKITHPVQYPPDPLVELIKRVEKKKRG